MFIFKLEDDPQTTLEEIKQRIADAMLQL